MTQEEKDLLFEELSARLPHGLKVLEDLDKTFDGGAIDELKTVTYIHDEQYVYTKHSVTPVNMEEVRPYLRPFDDMSDEEKKYISDKCGFSFSGLIGGEFGLLMPVIASEWLIDFYNKRHIDYRGLIPKGLALKALPDMYEFKD